MNFRRITMSLLVFVTGLTMAACRSNTSQNANPQNPQSAQGSQPASASQPASGASTAAAAPAPPPPTAAPAPPPPAVVVLPAGTHIRVRLDQDLGSKINNPGDSFSATVADEVVVNGTAVIPRGARADGTVVDAKPLGRFIGGGAGLGALIGGLAGGGKGALLGAMAGGGAGTAGSAFTGNKQIVLPAETMLTFRLDRPIHITEQ